MREQCVSSVHHVGDWYQVCQVFTSRYGWLLSHRRYRVTYGFSFAWLQAAGQVNTFRPWLRYS